MSGHRAAIHPVVSGDSSTSFFHVARVGGTLDLVALGRHPPRLVVDQAVQRVLKKREALLSSRKNDEAYVLDLRRPHRRDRLARLPGVRGAGLLFSKTGTFPRFSRTPCFLGCAGPIRSLEHGIFKEFVVALVA
jgi:hypothetical protein